MTQNEFKQELYTLLDKYKESLLTTCEEKGVVIENFSVTGVLRPRQSLTQVDPVDYAPDVWVEETFKLKH